MAEKINEQSILSWESVEKYLQEKTPAGFIMAIIETEKIFSHILDKLNYPGKNTDEKIENIKQIFSNYKELKLARQTYQKIISEPRIEIRPNETKNILSAYYQAIRDLTRAQRKKKNFIEKAIMRLKQFFPQPQKTLKKIGFALIIFFFTVFLLDSTELGRSLVKTTVSIAHFIFSWVLLTVLLTAGVIIIILGSLFYFESRKRKKQKIRIEE